ncbi:MAG: 4Fe-4S binding protein [Sedimentisphaerales bacterium]|nr:4Fe-4S binding protein [Sedimentisphaerales bacterium]
MALRNIIKIDEEKCNGCGQCVTACAEGAIQIVNGKARLISEIYCDGLGACLGHCPQEAITIEQREAADFDEEATKKHLSERKKTEAPTNFVCPGMAIKKFKPKVIPNQAPATYAPSQLGQWPVQLKLVSPHASYFKNADLLLVADCVPFAMGDFHNTFLKDHNIAVGCPKLDGTELYIDKLAAILQANNLNSLKLIHMEVPCCSGLTHMARQAIAKSKIEMSFEDVTIDVQGNVVRTVTEHGPSRK